MRTEPILAGWLLVMELVHLGSSSRLMGACIFLNFISGFNRRCAFSGSDVPTCGDFVNLKMICQRPSLSKVLIRVDYCACVRSYG